MYNFYHLLPILVAGFGIYSHIHICQSLILLSDNGVGHHTLEFKGEPDMKSCAPIANLSLSPLGTQLNVEY
jgi:hypothetical protein